MLQKVSSLLVLTFCFYRSITVDNFRFGKKLPSIPFMVIDNLGLQMCFSECDAYSTCRSINYNRKLLVCELNNVKEKDSASLITDDDFVYNGMADQVNFGSVLFLAKFFLIEKCMNGTTLNMKMKFISNG